MEFFVSSVVNGYEEYREAAKRAVEYLGHTARRIEDEPSLASPPGPQRACLDAIQACDAVVLLLGERYGSIQKGSDKSATHEEWDEARRIGKHVLAFVEDVSQREAEQDRFVEEVSDWENGCKYASYGSSDDVYREVLRALAKFIADPTLSSKGWRRLRQVDQDARRAVRRSVSDSQTPLRFDRTAIRADLAAVLRDSDKDLIVSGESGVGKSALVLDATEPPALLEGSEALAVNLRDLPGTSVELSAALSEPLGDLLAHMDAPSRLLVIDAAEACTENKEGVFSHMVAGARRGGIRVVAVTASDCLDAVNDAMSRDGTEVETFTVPPLSDAEVSEAVERFPALDRFADHARMRELLRRPIMLDLLVRTSPSGVVPSEAEALQCVWQEFVCGAGSGGDGSPEDSERVMLQLAEHALIQGPPEELLSGLDFAAVARLRRSGLLRPRSTLPWERVPAFAHDLIRTYAVARRLLADADPAAALRDVGAPRWALPAARLACEALQSDQDATAAGVFERLQADFDALVADGFGERWADVPVEALLGVAEPLPLLKAAWPTLLRGRERGVRRVLRVLRLRHRDAFTSAEAAAPIPWAPYGFYCQASNPTILETFVADAVVQQLLDAGFPRGLEKHAAELISDWLFSHVMRQTPAGHSTRVALSDRIVEQCREQASQAQAALDQASTPPEDSGPSQPERTRLPSAAAMLRPGRRRPDRVTPDQWIGQASIGYLGLLGADLGTDGEEILRRVAGEAPDLLQHAVDPPGCGLALAQFSPGLLVHLVEAYYIVDQQSMLDDYYSLSSRDRCVREHVFVGLGVPSSSYCTGPFLAMLQHDFSGGVKCINRLLNQAARHRARTLIYRGFAPRPDADVSHHTHEMSITGAPRPYVGDTQGWAWYRSAVTGYEPCESALRALEHVSDKRIQSGAQPAEIAAELLEGAESLAMAALVFGILVRHLETAAEALDPFMAEPLVWHMEASRAAHERTDLAAPDPPGLVNTDRRAWNLKHVATRMIFRSVTSHNADGQRADQLRRVGQRLLDNAVSTISEDIPPAERREQAVRARDWAEALDQSCYDFTLQGGQVAMQQRCSPELELILDHARAGRDRLNREDGLLLRHTRRIGEGCVPDTTPAQLAEDIAMARNLLSDTSNRTHSTLEAAAAVAASALEMRFGRGQDVPAADLRWSADVLLRVADAAQSHESDAADLFGPLLDMGSGCSAARGLPYLLLPDASGLRHDLALGSRQGYRRLIAASGALAAHPTATARLACARSLDSIWGAPCNPRLLARCHHKVALKVARRSFQDCLTERRRSQRNGTRTKQRVRNAGVLSSVDAELIVPHGLLGAIRAISAAAASGACCHAEAQQDLDVLLDAFRRAMIVQEHGFGSSSDCALVAARAALLQAGAGHPAILLDHVLGSMPNPSMLAETLRALAAAAEEQATLAEAAHRHWPQVMDAVMDAANRSGILTDDRDGHHARAELIPNPAREWPYQTRELAGEPQSWADLLAWAPQVERWLAIAPGTRESIDQLVIAVRQLGIDDQVDTGLKWIEALVQATGAGRGSTFTLAEWLDELRPALATPEQQAMWSRILDMQVVSGNTQVSHLAD